MTRPARQGEGALSDSIRAALAWEPGLLLFRNSQAVMRKGARVYRGGLGNGSADLVGVLMGRFVALEVKVPGKDAEPAQAAWLASVRERGGFACVVDSVESARAAIDRANRGLLVTICAGVSGMEEPMTKKNRDADAVRPITITTGPDLPEPNPTLYGLLRDGEKSRPGEDGTLLDRLGGEAQAFMAEQIRVARHLRRPVKGMLTLAIAFTTGPDGSQTYLCDSKSKSAKIPPAPSMVFTGDDGELTGRPVEPLTELAYRREKNAATPTSAEPKAGAVSKA